MVEKAEDRAVEALQYAILYPEADGGSNLRDFVQRVADYLEARTENSLRVRQLSAKADLSDLKVIDLLGAHRPRVTEEAVLAALRDVPFGLRGSAKIAAHMARHLNAHLTPDSGEQLKESPENFNSAGHVRGSAVGARQDAPAPDAHQVFEAIMSGHEDSVSIDDYARIVRELYPQAHLRREGVPVEREGEEYVTSASGVVAIGLKSEWAWLDADGIIRYELGEVGPHDVEPPEPMPETPGVYRLTCRVWWGREMGDYGTVLSEWPVYADPTYERIAWPQPPEEHDGE